MQLNGMAELQGGGEFPTQEEPRQEAQQSAQKQEIPFELRYSKLAQETQQIERAGKLTFLISSMLHLGMSTLITKYGSNLVFETIKQIYQTKTDEEPFLFIELVKDLEPDAERRTELYKQMKKDAGNEATKISEQQQGSNQNRQYVTLAYYNGPNFLSLAEQYIDMMQASDNGTKINTSQGDHVMMVEFARYLLQFDDEANSLKQEIEQTDSNLFDLVELRAKNTDARKSQFQSSIEVLKEDLSSEIQRITNQLNQEFEEFKAKALADIEDVEKFSARTPEMQSLLKMLC